MDSSKSSYLSFLIRLWQVGSGNDRVWRITLESPQTREHWSFVSLEALVDFLEQQTRFDDRPKEVIPDD